MNRVLTEALGFIENSFDRFLFSYGVNDYGTAYDAFIQALWADAGIAYPFFLTRSGGHLSRILHHTGKAAELAVWLDTLSARFPTMHLLWVGDTASTRRLIDLRESNIRKGLPSIVVATLPKSASISVANIFNSGFNLPSFAYSLADIEIVESWARDYARGGACHVTHLLPTRKNIRRLKSCGVDRLIVHVRDPRQALLSWVHHVVRYPASLPHLLRGGFQENSIADRIEAVMETYIRDIQWIEGWLDAEEEIEIKFSRFEDFVQDRAAFIQGYLDFYGVPEKFFSMEDAVTAHAGTDYHYRAGLTDEWRTVVPPEAGRAPVRLAAAVVAAAVRLGRLITLGSVCSAKNAHVTQVRKSDIQLAWSSAGDADWWTCLSQNDRDMH
jgi:hypothetical protein